MKKNRALNLFLIHHFLLIIIFDLDHDKLAHKKSPEIP